MGALIGAMFGLGCALLAWRWLEPGWRPRPRVRQRRRNRIDELLASAGVQGVAAWQVVVLSAAAFGVAAVVMLAASGVPAIGVLFGLMAGSVPAAVLRGRAARRRREHGALWPDVVDHLTSAVRAGLSLPDALIQLGERGPEGLREPFVQFGRDYQSSGRFHQALDLLKERLADPTGDRVVEALRIARDVGGGDLGRVLRSLAGFLRDDQRTRGEVEARQSWTVTGARLAVAAPWIVLALMCFQSDVVRRYATTPGLIVLGGGAVACVVAYRLMIAIGRLPAEKRILA